MDFLAHLTARAALYLKRSRDDFVIPDHHLIMIVTMILFLHLLCAVCPPPLVVGSAISEDGDWIGMGTW